MFEGLFQPTHLIIIFAIALLVFGPKKLPELGKGLGEGIRALKEGMKDTPATPRFDRAEQEHRIQRNQGLSEFASRAVIFFDSIAALRRFLSDFVPGIPGH